MLIKDIRHDDYFNGRYNICFFFFFLDTQNIWFSKIILSQSLLLTVVWLVSWLVGWLVGWLLGCLAAWLFGR